MPVHLRLSKAGFSPTAAVALRQVVVIAIAYFAYMSTRRLFLPDYHEAALHAQQLIALEQSLGFFWEPAWQSWAIIHSKSAVIFLNWAYISVYAPVILVAGLALFILDRRRYYYYRNVVFVALGIAIVVYILFPLAPPRLMPSVFVDTIQLFGPSLYGGEEMNRYVNIFAAMPSMHFGWGLTFSVMCLRSGSRWLKLPGAVYPLLVFLAITVTGNHYITDAIGGSVIAIAAFGIVELGQRWRTLRLAITRG